MILCSRVLDQVVLHRSVQAINAVLHDGQHTRKRNVREVTEVIEAIVDHAVIGMIGGSIGRLVIGKARAVLNEESDESVENAENAETGKKEMNATDISLLRVRDLTIATTVAARRCLVTTRRKRVPERRLQIESGDHEVLITMTMTGEMMTVMRDDDNG